MGFRLSIVSFACVILSCQTAKSSDPSLVKSDTTTTCSSGQPFSFFLEPVNNPSALVLSGFKLAAEPNATYVARSPDSNTNRRFQLNVCVDDTVDPPKVAVRDAEIEIGNHLDVPVKQVIEAKGLEKSIFEQDSSSLQLILATDSSGSLGSSYRLRILGIPSTDHPDAVGVLWTYVNASGIETANVPTILVGKLSQGNVFGDDARCLNSGSLGRSSVAFSTGKADFIFCESRGGGLTWTREVIEVSIVDSSLNLPAAVRGVPQIFKGQDITKPIVTSHHNWCDQFEIKNDMVSYNFLQKGEDSCVKPPPTTIWGKVSLGGYLSIKYKGKSRKKAKLTCGHFLECTAP